MASEDEFSDLTDLEDDGGDYEKSKSSGKSQGKSSADNWRIQHALKVPRATSYTTQALYDQIHGNDIKLDPEYQRDVVWPDAKMIGLIDSVLRNFYIPPLIFSVIQNEDGTEKKICIDGKQRLSSIQRFMDGLIPHKDPTTSEKLWYTDNGSGRSRKRLLPERYRRVFANKQVVCVEYVDLTDSAEREIFQRVQLGMALTPAEKLQVLSTPRASFIRSLLSHFLTTSTSSSDPQLPASSQGSLTEFDWERGRAADFRCFSQITYLLHAFHYSTSSPPKLPKSSGSIQSLEKFLSDTAPLETAFQERVKGALKVLGDMAQDGGNAAYGGSVKEVFKNPAKLAPVEFVMSGVLVGAHLFSAGVRPLSEIGQGKGKDKANGSDEERRARKIMAEAIHGMRALVRETHVDIRNNERVSKTMLDYITSWSPGSSGSRSSSKTSEAGKVKKEKRKRDNHAPNDGDYDMEEGEVENTPRAKLTKLTGTSAKESSVLTPNLNLGTSGSGNGSAGLPKKPGLPVPIPLPSQPKPKPDRMAALKSAKRMMQTQPPPPPTASASNINGGPGSPMRTDQTPDARRSAGG